jgi:hypothetical protein
MNFSLKPHQLIAHWVPGFVVAFLIACVVRLVNDWPLGPLLSSGPIFLLAVAAFIVGQLIDAIRNNWIEGWGWWKSKSSVDVDWDFFFRCQDQRLENLDNFYYVYYLFDVNVLIAVALSVIIVVFGMIIGALANNSVVMNLPSTISHASLREWVASLAALVLMFFALGVLYRDAIDLRQDVAKLTNPQRAPHEGVCTRLMPSKIHKDGIGVFAIKYIPKGTEIFAGDDSELVWLESRELDGLPTNIRQLYDDFCVIKDKGRHYGCPKNFNCMTVGWYLNHSKNPNVESDDQFNFLAKRDISEGEELTVDYDTYNEWRVRPSYL